MILNALAEKLKRRSKDDFKGRVPVMAGPEAGHMI